jgi:hypothetical protein
MAGKALNVASSLTCPHGGTVQIISTNARVKGGGALLALAADTFTVVGCPFQIPAVVPIPSPCVTVRWILGDLQPAVGGVRTLSQTSAGLCLSAAQIPQGPVVVAATQAAAGSR